MKEAANPTTTESVLCHSFSRGRATVCGGFSLLAGASAEQGGEPAGDANRQHVVDIGRGVDEQEEADNDNGQQEEGVVEEDGEVGGLVVGDFVLLPQNT